MVYIMFASVMIFRIFICMINPSALGYCRSFIWQTSLYQSGKDTRFVCRSEWFDTDVFSVRFLLTTLGKNTIVFNDYIHTMIHKYCIH